MKTLLIPGGAGFIGSNLCEYFISKGNKVICLDNFSTGYYHNIQALVGHPQFQLIEGDIRDLATCQRACLGVDYVLHHAALGSVSRSIDTPLLSNEVNVTGFLHILVAAKEAGVKRVIYAASSSTYGDSVKIPKVEDAIGKPLSPYAVTKYVNELYADVFSKVYDLPCIGLRYFNVFGRRQNPKGAYAAVIPIFVSKLMAYESPIIHGDGENFRDFTYIDNVIQMNELAMETENPEALNQVFNTAVGERTSLNELAGHIKRYLAGYDAQIEPIEFTYGASRVGDIPHSLASIEKAQTLLGYQPTHTLEQGLKEAVTWYWEHLKENRLAK